LKVVWNMEQEERMSQSHDRPGREDMISAMTSRRDRSAMAAAFSWRRIDLRSLALAGSMSGPSKAEAADVGDPLRGADSTEAEA
jgi:hypothetical protein